MLAKTLQNANKSCWQIIKKNANILLTVNIVSNAKNIRKRIWICYFFYQGEKCTLIRERLRKKKRAREKIVLNFYKNEVEAETQKFFVLVARCVIVSLSFLSFKQPISLIYSKKN